MPAVVDELHPGLDLDEQERRHPAENRVAASLIKRLIQSHEVASLIT
ncbi:hypothetical protein [Streptomyces sp. WELS2]|nr:hypothetical protein [Streptomyces sp. WELS2]